MLSGAIWGGLTNLIMKQESKFKSLRETCLDFIIILNEDIIKAISPKQYDFLKSMGERLEKKLPIFAESSKAREDLILQFEIITPKDL